MEKAKMWLGLLLLCAVLAGTIAGIGSCSQTTWQAPPVIAITYGGIPEWCWTQPDDMMEHADLVVQGTYLGEAEGGKPYPMTTIPTGYGSLSVSRVLKGSCGDTVNFYYTGGSIYKKEAIETAEREGLDRELHQIYPRLESTDPRAHVIVVAGKGEMLVHPEAGKEYLVFLSYEPNTFQDYMLMCAHYGLREINQEGQAYDYRTGNYETLAMLEE